MANTKTVWMVAVSNEDLLNDGFQYSSESEALDNAISDIGVGVGDTLVVAKVVISDPTLYEVAQMMVKKTNSK